MNYCKTCPNSYEDASDERFGGPYGSTYAVGGNIVEYLACGLTGEMCPEEFTDCPKVEKVIDTLPRICQECKDLPDCHFFEGKFQVDFRNINECYGAEEYPETETYMVPEDLEVKILGKNK